MHQSRTAATACLLAPQDAGDRMVRAQFVLGMLAAVGVLTATLVLLLALS